MDGKSVAFKNELLFKNGINFDRLPNWQKRGVGVYWETYEKKGFNPVIGKEEMTLRHTLKVDEELPIHEEYSKFIEKILAESVEK